MKRILLACLLLSLTAMTAFAEISRTLNYQGRIMDASGNPVPDSTPTNITINLWNDPTSTNASNLIWTNSYAGTATKNGYFNLVFTGGYPAFSWINFDQQLYVGIVINGGAEMMPRQLLNASASAMTVADGSITNNKLAAGSVGTTTIANGAVTSTQIAASTIKSTNIGSGQVTGGNGGNIGASTITNYNMAVNSVAASNISSLPTIYGSDIAGQTITGANIVNSTITQTQASFAPAVAINGASLNFPKIACGLTASDGSGNAVITFPTNFFSQPPYVSCTPINETNSVSCVIDGNHITAASVGVFTRYSGTGVGYATNFHWIAVGY